MVAVSTWKRTKSGLSAACEFADGAFPDSKNNLRVLARRYTRGKVLLLMPRPTTSLLPCEAGGREPLAGLLNKDANEMKLYPSVELDKPGRNSLAIRAS